MVVPISGVSNLQTEDGRSYLSLPSAEGLKLSISENNMIALYEILKAIGQPSADQVRPFLLPWLHFDVVNIVLGYHLGVYPELEEGLHGSLLRTGMNCEKNVLCIELLFSAGIKPSQLFGFQKGPSLTLKRCPAFSLPYEVRALFRKAITSEESDSQHSDDE